MDAVIIFALLFAAGIPLYYFMRFIRRGTNRIISGGSYKLEQEMTTQVWQFASNAAKESLILKIKAHFPEANKRLAWKSGWICVRNGDMLVFAYGVVDVAYATGNIPHIKAGMRFDDVENGVVALFNFISWTQSDGVCPHTKEMVTLTETIKALFRSADPNVKTSVSAVS